MITTVDTIVFPVCTRIGRVTGFTVNSYLAIAVESRTGVGPGLDV